MRRRALGIGPGWRPIIPGPQPGAPNIPPGTLPAATAANIFPTNVKWGDVVQISGPFGGVEQGRVVVRFAGAEPQAVFINGPWGGSAVVPDGAETGACRIELDGRTIFGATCSVTPSTEARAPEHRGREHWGVMTKSNLMGVGSYVPLSRQRRYRVSGTPRPLRRALGYIDDGFESTRGVGAIAATDLSPIEASRPMDYRTGVVPLYPGVTVKATSLLTADGRMVLPGVSVLPPPETLAQVAPVAPLSTTLTKDARTVAPTPVLSPTIAPTIAPMTYSVPEPAPPWRATTQTASANYGTAPKFEPMPTPEEIQEAETVTLARVGMSKTTKMILGGIAVVGLIVLLKGKKR